MKAMTKPTENELFEKFFPKPTVFNSYHEQQKLMGQWHDCKRGWMTKATLADKQIAELEDNLINIGKENADLSFLNDTLKAENEQLKAQIYELREALEKVIFHAEFRAQDEDTARAVAIGQLIVIEELANEYLAKPAPQCLIQHDNEVIDKVLNLYSPDDTADDYMDKIRALKGSE